jgi:hypothetical protein
VIDRRANLLVLGRLPSERQLVLGLGQRHEIGAGRDAQGLQLRGRAGDRQVRGPS